MLKVTFFGCIFLVWIEDTGCNCPAGHSG